MKTCKVCGLDKPFDPTAKTNSKASGFNGKVCWDCRIAGRAYAEYLRDRRASDPLFKLRGNISSLIGRSIRQRGYSKSTKTAQLVGCDYEFLMSHLRSTLPDWESHEVIHIDHIIPCSAARDETELLALQHWSNLQWLPGPENLSKSASLPDGWESRLRELVATSQTVPIHG